MSVYTYLAFSYENIWVLLWKCVKINNPIGIQQFLQEFNQKITKIYNDTHKSEIEIPKQYANMSVNVWFD